ncbi:MAG: alpha/beta hydrolase [Pseudomonadota bacterium]
MSNDTPLYCDLANAPEHGRALWVMSGRRRLRCAIWDGGTRGTVLLFTGRTEYIEKYGRVVTSLTERGFNVATLDWRGQGLSDRPLGDPMKGHVGGFDAYQMDVEAFCTAPEITALPGPHVLLCHSMGGCIGMRALLEERVEPDAVIMSAPMLGLTMTPVQRIALDVLIRLSARFDFETVYVPGRQSSRPYVETASFEENVLTGDRDHYAWFAKHLEAEPGFGLGAPTIGWMARAGEEMEALSHAPSPEMPLLMLLGEAEAVVSSAAIRAFDAKAPSCRLVELPEAKHEILMETPAIRQTIWGEIDRFLVDQGI